MRTIPWCNGAITGNIMLLYRLILLSWCVFKATSKGHHSSKKQRIITPSHQHHQQNLINAQNGLLRQQQVGANQRTINSQQQLNQLTLPNSQQTLNQQRMLNNQQRMVNNQQRMVSNQQRANTRFMHQSMRFHHPMRPTNVRGHSKDLMSQVVASAMHHGPSVHRPDHPRKYVDYFDNGATWDHLMSKAKHHNDEMHLDDSSYHVDLKYSNHDELEEGDKLMHGNNGETYPGETISGENSLSKFMSPPVYDSDQDIFQRNQLQQYEQEDHYHPSTPQEAETEHENTEQLVNRLNAVMSPLSAPFTEGAKKTNMADRATSEKKMADKKSLYRNHYQTLSEVNPRTGEEEQAMVRERLFRYRNHGGGHGVPDRPMNVRGEERMLQSEKENERYQDVRENANMRENQNMRENAGQFFHSDDQYKYFHRNGEGTPTQHNEDERDDERNGVAYQRSSAVDPFLHKYGYNSRHGYNERMYREQVMRERPRALGRFDNERVNMRDREDAEDMREDDKSLINNLKTKPENEFDSKFHDEMHG